MTKADRERYDGFVQAAIHGLLAAHPSASSHVRLSSGQIRAIAEAAVQIADEVMEILGERE